MGTDLASPLVLTRYLVVIVVVGALLLTVVAWALATTTIVVLLLMTSVVGLTERRIVIIALVATTSSEATSTSSIAVLLLPIRVVVALSLDLTTFVDLFNLFLISPRLLEAFRLLFWLLDLSTLDFLSLNNRGRVFLILSWLGSLTVVAFPAALVTRLLGFSFLRRLLHPLDNSCLLFYLGLAGASASRSRFLNLLFLLRLTSLVSFRLHLGDTFNKLVLCTAVPRWFSRLFYFGGFSSVIFVLLLRWLPLGSLLAFPETLYLSLHVANIVDLELSWWENDLDTHDLALFLLLVLLFGERDDLVDATHLGPDDRRHPDSRVDGRAASLESYLLTRLESVHQVADPVAQILLLGRDTHDTIIVLEWPLLLNSWDFSVGDNNSWFNDLLLEGSSLFICILVSFLLCVHLREN
jgi:hypothetical protein